MMLDHITPYLKFVKRLHIYQSRITPNIMECHVEVQDDHDQFLKEVARAFKL